MHALHSGHSGGLFAGASSPFLLSLPFLLFLFSLLSSPPLSVLFKKKNDLGKRAPGKQPHGWYGGHLGSSICGLWARVKHLYCAQKPRNRSSGEAKQNAKTNKIQCSSKTKKILKDTLSVSKDTVDGILDSWSQQGDIAPCTAEVWPTSSF